MRQALSVITLIVSVGSVDGVCTSAALLRLIGRDNVGIEFTQAFTVDKLDPSKWPASQKVAFVDLAVNNRDKAMTADFVRRLREAGHEIVAVIDEHNREDWVEALGSIDDLIIKPCTQGVDPMPASGAVLMAAMDEGEIDDHTNDLLWAAIEGDRMNFDTHFGGIVNRAVKSNIGDDSRRVHLARHLAQCREPDSTIHFWITEYGVILMNHKDILAAKTELGDGMVRVVTTGKRVDMTTLMATLYENGTKVAIVEGEVFNKAAGGKTVQIGFGTNDTSIDLMAVVRSGGVIPLGGFTQKVNITPQDEEAATVAIRNDLQRRGKLYEASNDPELHDLRVDEERSFGGRRYIGSVAMAPSGDARGDIAQYAKDIGPA